MIGHITVSAPVVHSPSIWRFVGQKCRFDLIEQVEHTGAALDGLIELEVKKRGVLENDPTGELMLEVLALDLKLLDRLFLLPLRADGADEDVGILQVRRDVDGADGDKRSLEFYFTPDDYSKLPLDQFTDP